MITIIHGDDIVASRSSLQELKLSSTHSLHFDGELLTYDNLFQATEGATLFKSDNEIFIEDLLSKRKQSKELESIIEHINHSTQETKFVLWEGKELTPKQTLLFENAQMKLYKLPQTIFAFLDSLQPGKQAALVQAFHNGLKSSEPQLLFFLIVRQIRLLIAISDIGAETIDEVKRLAPWQRTKLKRQANLFSPQQLRSAHDAIFAIEKQQKTGESNLNLTQAIDFFLLDL